MAVLSGSITVLCEDEAERDEILARLEADQTMTIASVDGLTIRAAILTDTT